MSFTLRCDIAAAAGQTARAPDDASSCPACYWAPNFDLQNRKRSIGWRAYRPKRRSPKNMHRRPAERPVFHQVQRSAETRTFLRVSPIACRRRSKSRSSARAAHTSGRACATMRLRKASTLESEHLGIYRLLGIDWQVMPPKTVWRETGGANGDEKIAKLLICRRPGPKPPKLGQFVDAAYFRGVEPGRRTRSSRSWFGGVPAGAMGFSARPGRACGSRPRAR